MRQLFLQSAVFKRNLMLKKIVITGVPEARERLHYELQSGSRVETESGITLLSFLTGSCGIPESYIADKVKTIFHNSNPVDNAESVRLNAESVVAISGAMPGLVGAMMRMGSPYAAMRESITEKSEDIAHAGDLIHVTLKLFNVILRDLWKGFVEKGIILDSERILGIIKKSEVERGSPFNIEIDGTATGSSETDRLTDEQYIVISR